jgi:hypothetical protein
MNTDKRIDEFKQHSAPGPIQKVAGADLWCAENLLLLCLLGQLYLCAFQLFGHASYVLLVNVCRD